MTPAALADDLTGIDRQAKLTQGRSRHCGGMGVGVASLGMMVRLFIAWAVAALLLINPARAQETPQEVTQLTLGVLATEGATRALEAWTPTLDLLNRAAVAQKSPFRFRMEPHTDASLIDGLDAGRIDLMLGDPAAFVIADVEERARPLLSMAHIWQGRTFDRTGAVIFVRADSAIATMQDVSDKRIMGVAANELTGWQLALQEFRKHRLPSDIGASAVFSGGNQREIVYAVQNGLVDVGVIRAGVLERLAAQGVIKMEDFRPVGVVAHPEFPFWVSTPLYPDWVMASLPDVPDAALALLIDTLLQVSENSAESRAANGVVWQAPQNYQSVHELLISLRVRPYENYLTQAAIRIYRAYQWPVLGLLALILASLVFFVREFRRNARLTEAHKDVLRSEARSKQFYRNAIEHHTVFCMLNRDGVISHVNDRFVSALDRSRGSLMDRPLAELMKGTNQQTLEAEIMKAMHAGAPWQGALQLTREDGKSVWVQSTFIPVTGASNTLSEIAIVASDVTKTRAGVSETRFNDTLELIQDKVVVLRPGTLDILHMNTAAVKGLVNARMGGRWKGKQASALISEADFETLKLRCDAIASGPQRRMVWEAEAQDGTTYEISLEYVRPAADAPQIIAIYRDVSERKMVDKAKTEFIATVSHELRTPLTSIKGALGIATSGAVGEMPDKMANLVGMAARSCDRLVVLINDILDIEKIEAGKMDFNMEVFDLTGLVTAALENNAFYAGKLGVTFEALPIPQGESFLTYGDESRLLQVLDNLMSNAAKFSPQGARVMIGLEQQADRLRLIVRDKGEGIPLDAQPTIFDKFTQADSSDTRAKGGTGLGLSIVKLIVEHHQGRVSFMSTEGEGTEFFVDLPRVEGETVLPIPSDNPLADLTLKIAGSDASPLVQAESIAAAAAHRLMALIRAKGIRAEADTGAFTAQMLAASGHDGDSPALRKYFDTDTAAPLAALLAQASIDAGDICAVEIAQVPGVTVVPADHHRDAMELVQAWLWDSLDGQGAAAKTTLLAITPDRELQGWLAARGVASVADAALAQSFMAQNPVDAIAQFSENARYASVTLSPLASGTLPADWPVTLITTRSEVTAGGRGIISKFTSGGGGRGRRRAS